MNKEIVHIMNDISSWLRYQKQLAAGADFHPGI